MGEDRKQRFCESCGTKAPPTETAHTLIGSRFGWRCIKTDVGGKKHLAWYCAACWKRRTVKPPA